MTAAQITSALGARRTVRVTYSRTNDEYRVDIRQGDRITMVVATGLTSERNAEGRAACAARLFDLEVSRLDVP